MDPISLAPAKRHQLAPGTAFSLTGEPSGGLPCVALAPDFDSRLHPLYRQPAGPHGPVLWHCYTPSGSVTWTMAGSDVWVKGPENG